MDKDNRTAVIIKTVLVSACQVLSMFKALPLQAGEYEKLAGSLARAARAHARKRLAVLPFGTLGLKPTSGRIVAERMLGPLMEDGSVEVVERQLLEAVVREQRLQVSGLVDSRSVRELGRILDVDAVVTGTVTALKNDKLEVNARLIDTETAKVLGAASARVEKDWEEPFFDADAWSSFPAIPKLDLAMNASAGDWGLRDSVSDCGHFLQDVDALERAAVDLKARFWASKLAEGLDARSLTRNPGSEIKSEAIRGDFYERLNRYHTSGAIVNLADGERQRLAMLLGKIKTLNEACGGE
jgi:TolB-like protein